MERPDLQSAALPIDQSIPAIRQALREATRLVLAAPPGAGKTTRVSLALLDEAWLAGRILLLEPRRIAARLAAERMAASLGERVGDTIGLTTRVDRKVSARTRIEVITDGLFTRRILSDPELAGIGLVIFDEFHERSLNLDLGLALALDSQRALRPDLRLIAMSATLDVARLAAAIAAPVVESFGRAHPVETVYLGRSRAPIESDAANAVRKALAERHGSILVFLPGRAEILRTAERLSDAPPEVIIAPLYGALSPAEQDCAVAPPPAGARKVVLATDIAESSLTIESVSTVIDSGLARIAEHDPDAGPRLVTRRAARANVDQRRGRAGRTGPGVCYRLWDEAATRGLAAEPIPEILMADLSALALALAEWGERDPLRLTWIDPPPPGRLAAARAALERLGALGGGAVTAKGRAMAALPLEPRLAAMIVAAADAAHRALAAEIAAVVGEPGLGGDSIDLRDRITRFRQERSARAAALRALAARWAKGAEPASVDRAGAVVAAAFPQFLARRRGQARGRFLTAGGRAADIAADDALAGVDWLAIAAMTGTAGGGRVLAAAPLAEADALAQAETSDLVAFDAARKALTARRVRRIGAIVLSETPLAAPAGAAARAALLDAVRAQGLDLLDAHNAVCVFLARLAAARKRFPDEWPDWTEADLLARADSWLAPLLGDPPSLSRPNAEQLQKALAGLLDRRAARTLDDIAPVKIAAPSGRALAVDYRAAAGPSVAAPVQEFFGAAAHPSILRGGERLLVTLLSPAGRPVAATRDLPGFWAGAYRDMAKDMRARYPKHDWPDDPAAARPHAGKPRARRRKET